MSDDAKKARLGGPISGIWRDANGNLKGNPTKYEIELAALLEEASDGDIDAYMRYLDRKTELRREGLI